MSQAKGTFTVDLKPLTPTPAEGITRYSMHKHLTGDLSGSTQGEMFSAGDPKSGHAGYVAIEVVTATLEGRQGTFALQHLASMDATGSHMQIQVVPGSGADALAGLVGTFLIEITEGTHHYTLSYDLPEAAG